MGKCYGTELPWAFYKKSTDENVQWAVENHSGFAAIKELWK